MWSFLPFNLATNPKHFNDETLLLHCQVLLVLAGASQVPPLPRHRQALLAAAVQVPVPHQMVLAVVVGCQAGEELNGYPYQ
jgi:hypothetical protein